MEPVAKAGPFGDIFDREFRVVQEEARLPDAHQAQIGGRGAPGDFPEQSCQRHGMKSCHAAALDCRAGPGQPFAHPIDNTVDSRFAESSSEPVRGNMAKCKTDESDRIQPGTKRVAGSRPRSVTAAFFQAQNQAAPFLSNGKPVNGGACFMDGGKREMDEQVPHRSFEARCKRRVRRNNKNSAGIERDPFAADRGPCAGIGVAIKPPIRRAEIFVGPTVEFHAVAEQEADARIELGMRGCRRRHVCFIHK